MENSRPKTVVQARALRKRMTKAEVLLWSRLRRNPSGDLRFRKQHPIGPYIADFACVAHKLIVEVDGDSHGSDAGISHDRHRTRYMQAQGWQVYRVANVDVLKRLDEVMDAIMRFARS